MLIFGQHFVNILFVPHKGTSTQLFKECVPGYLEYCISDCFPPMSNDLAVKFIGKLALRLTGLEE